MMTKLKQCPLFFHLSEQEIKDCLQSGGAEIGFYEKDQTIFLQEDKPERLYVLLEGSVVVGNDSVAGKRTIITTLNKAGELFGEVFLFLGKEKYDHYALAAEPSQILRVPRECIYHNHTGQCQAHMTLISNMLSILAQKAYYLNQKLQILSSATLRQKIAKVLLQNTLPGGNVHLPMNREELADYLNVARPSLSRELMNMQKDGLIKTDRRKIFILDPTGLQNS